MNEEIILTAIDRHWAASAAGDQLAEHVIYHDDVVCEYPQSGETIRGRHNLQSLRSHHRVNRRGLWCGVSWERAIYGLRSM